MGRVRVEVFGAAAAVAAVPAPLFFELDLDLCLAVFLDPNSEASVAKGKQEELLASLGGCRSRRRWSC